MGPKRNKTARPRAVPYDPELLENWTILRLQQECTKKGITFRSNMRRFALIRLLRERDQSEVIISAQAPNTSNSQNNNNGGAQGQLPILVDLVSSLQDTVSSLQNSVISLEQRVNDLVTNTVVPSADEPLQPDCPPAVPPRKRQCFAQPVNNNPQRNYVNIPQSEAPPAPEYPVYDINSAYQRNNINNNFALGSENQSQPCSASGMPSNNSDFNINTAYLRNNNLDSGCDNRNTGIPSNNRVGVASQSLPLVETISPSLRTAIIAGRDVNLASLLIPYFNGSSDNSVKDKDEKPDPRLNRSLTLAEFIQAFGVYKHIMCKAFPLRRNELDMYERDVVEMASRYDGKGFYEYHRQFSLRAASHLRYNNILVDWSIRDNTLFCNIFANFQPTICVHCNSTMHSSAFCETLLNQGRYNNNRRGLGEAQNNFGQGRMFGENNDTDRLGRRRVVHLGKEICDHFNGPKGCYVNNCLRLHACLNCKGPHSQSACPLGKTWPQSKRK